MDVVKKGKSKKTKKTVKQQQQKFGFSINLDDLQPQIPLQSSQLENEEGFKIIQTVHAEAERPEPEPEVEPEISTQLVTQQPYTEIMKRQKIQEKNVDHIEVVVKADQRSKHNSQNIQDLQAQKLEKVEENVRYNDKDLSIESESISKQISEPFVVEDPKVNAETDRSQFKQSFQTQKGFEEMLESAKIQKNVKKEFLKTNTKKKGTKLKGTKMAKQSLILSVDIENDQDQMPREKESVSQIISDAPRLIQTLRQEDILKEKKEEQLLQTKIQQEPESAFAKQLVNNQISKEQIAIAAEVEQIKSSPFENKISKVDEGVVKTGQQKHKEQSIDQLKRNQESSQEVFKTRQIEQEEADSTAIQISASISKVSSGKKTKKAKKKDVKVKKDIQSLNSQIIMGDVEQLDVKQEQEPPMIKSQIKENMNEVQQENIQEINEKTLPEQQQNQRPEPVQFSQTILENKNDEKIQVLEEQQVKIQINPSSEFIKEDQKKIQADVDRIPTKQIDIEDNKLLKESINLAPQPVDNRQLIENVSNIVISASVVKKKAGKKETKKTTKKIKQQSIIQLQVLQALQQKSNEVTNQQPSYKSQSKQEENMQQLLQEKKTDLNVAPSDTILNTVNENKEKIVKIEDKKVEIPEVIKVPEATHLVDNEETIVKQQKVQYIANNPAQGSLTIEKQCQQSISKVQEPFHEQISKKQYQQTNKTSQIEQNEADTETVLSIEVKTKKASKKGVKSKGKSKVSQISLNPFISEQAQIQKINVPSVKKEENFNENDENAKIETDTAQNTEEKQIVEPNVQIESEKTSKQITREEEQKQKDQVVIQSDIISLQRQEEPKDPNNGFELIQHKHEQKKLSIDLLPETNIEEVIKKQDQQSENVVGQIKLLSKPSKLKVKPSKKVTKKGDKNKQKQKISNNNFHQVLLLSESNKNPVQQAITLSESKLNDENSHACKVVVNQSVNQQIQIVQQFTAKSQIIKEAPSIEVSPLSKTQKVKCFQHSQNQDASKKICSKQVEFNVRSKDQRSEKNQIIAQLIKMVKFQGDKGVRIIKDRLGMLEEDVRSHLLRKHQRMMNLIESGQLVSKGERSARYNQIIQQNLSLRKVFRDKKLSL